MKLKSLQEDLGFVDQQSNIGLKSARLDREQPISLSLIFHSEMHLNRPPLRLLEIRLKLA